MNPSIIDEPDWDQAADWQSLAEAAGADAAWPDYAPSEERAPRPRRRLALRPRVLAIGVLSAASIAGVVLVVLLGLLSPATPRPHAGRTPGQVLGAGPAVPPSHEPTAPVTGATSPPPTAHPTASGTGSTSSRGVPTPTPPRTAGTPTHTTAPAAPVTPASGTVVRIVNPRTGMAISATSSADGSPIEAIHSTGATARWRLVSSNGCYSLVNVGTGKALDNPDGSREDGTTMQLWTYIPGNANQTWCFTGVGPSLYSLLGYSGGCLLDLRDGGTADGTVIQQWGAPPQYPDDNQTWRLVQA